VACTTTVGTCPHCNRRLHQTHGHCQESLIEPIPILEKRVLIHVRWPRFVCPDCHQKTTSFHPQWLNKTGNKTIVFEHYVLKQLIHSTVSDVSVKLQLTNETVEGIVNRHIKIDYDWSLNHPRVVTIDWFHVAKLVGEKVDKRRKKLVAELKQNAQDDPETLEQI
ncbi:MAG: hypothetical protein GXP14_17360, partial [Gammaproteobacteria bacterium]|nr:hypothetical protein [Gammaproteobacteria bacterium]